MKYFKTIRIFMYLLSGRAEALFCGEHTFLKYECNVQSNSLLVNVKLLIWTGLELVHLKSKRWFVIILRRYKTF